MRSSTSQPRSLLGSAVTALGDQIDLGGIAIFAAIAAFIAYRAGKDTMVLLTAGALPLPTILDIAAGVTIPLPTPSDTVT